MCANIQTYTFAHSLNNVSASAQFSAIAIACNRQSYAVLCSRTMRRRSSVERGKEPYIRNFIYCIVKNNQNIEIPFASFRFSNVRAELICHCYSFDAMCLVNSNTRIFTHMWQAGDMCVFETERERENNS